MPYSESTLPRVLDHIPDGIHYTTCTHDCPDACNIQLTVKDRHITKITGDSRHPYTSGYICSKTRHEIIETFNQNKSRIKTPLIKKNGQWEKISWPDALDTICNKIYEAKEKYGPLSILHYHGAGQYAALPRIYNKRFFTLLGGTSRICGSICDTAISEGQIMDFGGQRTHEPQDILNSKFVMIWGKNPANTGPHFTKNLTKLKKKGIDVVLVDPIETRTASSCKHHLKIAPNTDRMLALAMANLAIKNDWIDTDFIENHTYGFESFKDIALSIDLQEAATTCGVTDTQIADTARKYFLTSPASIWLGAGLQRYNNGGETIRFIDALGALSGNIGIAGGGVSHQNNEGPKFFDFDLTLEDSIEKSRFLRKSAIAEDLENTKEPPIKVVFVNGVNPVTQCPNSLRVKRAFENIDFVVVIEAFMTDTAICADIILPTTRLLEEDDVMWAYGNHYIGLTRQILPKPGETKSDFEIFQSLAERMGFGEKMAGTQKEWINKVLKPVRHHGISYDSLLEGEQVNNPNLPAVAFHDLEFPTKSGRFEFIQKIETPLSKEDNEAYPYYFLTIHHHAWLNSNIFTEKQKKSIGSPAFAFIHPKTAQTRDLVEGERVIVYSSIGEMEAEIKISEKYHPEAVVIYQGGGIEEKLGSNLITDDRHISDFGDMAAYYSTMINIKKMGTTQQ